MSTTNVPDEILKFLGNLFILTFVNIAVLFPLFTLAFNRHVWHRYEDCYIRLGELPERTLLRKVLRFVQPLAIVGLALYLGGSVAVSRAILLGYAKPFAVFVAILSGAAYLVLITSKVYSLHIGRWIRTQIWSEVFLERPDLVYDELYRRFVIREGIFEIFRFAIVQSAFIQIFRDEPSVSGKINESNGAAEAEVSVILLSASILFLITLVRRGLSLFFPHHEVLKYCVADPRPVFVEGRERNYQTLHSKTGSPRSWRSTHHRDSFRVAARLERCQRLYIGRLDVNQRKVINSAIVGLASIIRRVQDSDSYNQFSSREAREWAAALVSHGNPLEVARKAVDRYSFSENVEIGYSRGIIERVTLSGALAANLVSLGKTIGIVFLLTLLLALGRVSNLLEELHKFVSG